VELNRQGVPRTDLNKVAQFHRLALVKSRKVEFSPVSGGADSAMFTPAEMRHNFAIWAAKQELSTGREAHLYYCIRCKQAFSADDRSRSVTPLDPQGNPIQGSEAVKRLATFGQGPCPAFSGLRAGPRSTRKVRPIRGTRGRFTKLILTGNRTWRAVVGPWRRFLARNGFRNQTSKRQ
jgi:hypothetical protein